MSGILRPSPVPWCRLGSCCRSVKTRCNKLDVTSTRNTQCLSVRKRPHTSVMTELQLAKLICRCRNFVSARPFAMTDASLAITFRFFILLIFVWFAWMVGLLLIQSSTTQHFLGDSLRKREFFFCEVYFVCLD
uniref:(northern house mosquito) hypothetical protein n=1 Tax=Culex pipiens TaxID=7175 RepID=A0A8D8G134_CULPI